MALYRGPNLRHTQPEGRVNPGTGVGGVRGREVIARLSPAAERVTLENASHFTVGIVHGSQPL